MTDRSQYSDDPYQDGTVPADADFAASGTDEAGPETTGDELVGSTGDGASDPDALVEGNRVATAEDME